MFLWWAPSDVPYRFVSYARLQVGKDGTSTVEVLLQKVQADNMLPDPPTPVMLVPTPVRGEPKPFLHVRSPGRCASRCCAAVSLTWWMAELQFSAAARPKHNNLQYVDYTSVLVQEMEIALDEEFLRRLLSFALELAPYGDTPQSRSSGSERDQGTVFERAPVRWWQQGHPGSSEGSTASTRYFFQELQFNALCLNVSFRRVPSAVDQSLTLISPVTLTLNALGMVAMSVERSPLRLSGLKMSQVLQTRTGLVSRVVRHYRNQGLQVRPSLGFGHCPRRLLCSRCAHAVLMARRRPGIVQGCVFLGHAWQSSWPH